MNVKSYFSISLFSWQMIRNTQMKKIGIMH